MLCLSTLVGLRQFWACTEVELETAGKCEGRNVVPPVVFQQHRVTMWKRRISSPPRFWFRHWKFHVFPWNLVSVQDCQPGHVLLCCTEGFSFRSAPTSLWAVKKQGLIHTRLWARIRWPNPGLCKASTCFHRVLFVMVLLQVFWGPAPKGLLTYQAQLPWQDKVGLCPKCCLRSKNYRLRSH